MPCASNYMTFWERLNYGDIKQISGCQIFRWGGEWVGLNRWNAKDFQGDENILYDTETVDMWHYTTVKAHRTLQHNVQP